MGLDNQGKQPAETFLGRVQDRCRKAHHLAEGFIVQGMPGSQQAVVTGKGKHGLGVHIDQPGSKPEAVFQRLGIDDIQHHGRLAEKNLPADVDILAAEVHEADDIFTELDSQMLPACKGQHPAFRLKADDIDQDAFLLRDQFTFATVEIAIHKAKITVFYGKGNTNKL